MWTRAVVKTASAAVALSALGCTPQQAGPVVVVEDKTYAVSPDVIPVKAGIMTGHMKELRVMERVEKGSGTVVTPAKLSGKLHLRNGSTDQTVRLIEGKIRFMDMQGEPMKVDAKVIERSFRFSGYGQTERLDPGQEATQNIDVEIPVEALQAKKLKTIRLDLVYLPASYREETVSLPVSIGAQ